MAERPGALAALRPWRSWIVAGAALGVVLGLTAFLLVIRGDRSDAEELGRGAPVALPSSVAAMPPALDAAAALGQINEIRAQVATGLLAASECLDASAAATAAAFAGGAVPQRLAPVSGCEAATGPSVGPNSVHWGWVSGADPTGAAQLEAAFARGASGSSALAAAEAKQLGLSLDRRTDAAGRVTGFVLVWAVSS